MHLVVRPLEPGTVRLRGGASIFLEVCDEVPPEMVPDRDPLLRLSGIVRGEVLQEPPQGLRARFWDSIPSVHRGEGGDLRVPVPLVLPERPAQVEEDRSPPGHGPDLRSPP